MEFLARIRSLFGNLFGFRRVDADLNEEVASYRELLAEQNVRQGMSAAEARRQAGIHMEGETQLREQVRSARAGFWLQTFWQDVRYGARILRKNPGFTLACVITFGVGIGANAALFSMANALLFRPVPASHSEQLVYLIQHNQNFSSGFSYPDFQDIRRQSGGAFSDTAGVKGDFQRAGLAYNGHSQDIWACYVTTNFFPLMGVHAALGELITPEQELQGSSPVLVLGYAYWKTRLGGDASILGRQVSINGRPVTVIGVAPQDFHGASNFEDAQGYLPLGMAEGFGNNGPANALNDRKTPQLLAIARLRDGGSLQQARSVMSVIAGRLAKQYPELHKNMTIKPVLLGSGFVNSTGNNPIAIASALFLSLAAMVLLLAAANVAGLLLTRAVARNCELAVRSALGASRSRLLRQIFTEIVVLVALGLLAGIALGMAGSRSLTTLSLQTDYPLVFDFQFDWRVFLYAFGAAALVSLAGGVAPARRAFGLHVNDVMRESARNASPVSQKLRTFLIIGQVAVSLMLLIIAGLFVRSLRSVEHSDLGFDPGHVANLTIDVRMAGYDAARGKALLNELLARARTLPGVESASFASSVPFGIENEGAGLEIDGVRPEAGRAAPFADLSTVTPEYFRTMRIPLLRGREFADSDTETGARVAIINQTMAQRYWPGKDPLGHIFTRSDDPQRKPLQVIGIVRDSRYDDLSGPFPAIFYLPFSQNYGPTQILQLRAASTSDVTREAISLVRSLQPALPASDVQTMDAVVDGVNGFFLYRLAAAVSGILGALGLILAVVGVYGVLSYAAAQRTHEIGIRMALGAHPMQAVMAIVRQGLTIVGFGVVFGLLAAMGVARLAAGFLAGVSPLDPITYAGVSLLLGAIALAACFIPARRASRVDPVVALRHE